MSDNETIPQEPQPEDEAAAATTSATATSAELPDNETADTDRPIIIQGGGSTTPG